MGKEANKIYLTKGDIIRYKSNSDDDWKIVEVISKAGKGSGRFKNCYNVKHNDDEFYVNLDDVYQFEQLSNDDFDDDIEYDLRRKWTTLGSPISFGGVSKIYNYYNRRIRRKEIERILSTIPTYTKYKQRKNSKLNNPFFIYYVHQQWQIDVTYISQLQQYNDNISHLLIVMECFRERYL